MMLAWLLVEETIFRIVQRHASDIVELRAMRLSTRGLPSVSTTALVLQIDAESVSSERRYGGDLKGFL